MRHEEFTLRVCALIAFQMIFYLHSSQTNSFIVRKKYDVLLKERQLRWHLSKSISMFSLKGTSLEWILFLCLSNNTSQRNISRRNIFVSLKNNICQSRTLDVFHENTWCLSNALLSYFSFERYTWTSPVIKNRRTLCVA